MRRRQANEKCQLNKRGGREAHAPHKRNWHSYLILEFALLLCCRKSYTARGRRRQPCTCCGRFNRARALFRVQVAYEVLDLNVGI